MFRGLFLLGLPLHLLRPDGRHYESQLLTKYVHENLHGKCNVCFLKRDPGLCHRH